jgi:hypothetical protein
MNSNLKYSRARSRKHSDYKTQAIERRLNGDAKTGLNKKLRVFNSPYTQGEVQLQEYVNSLISD